MLVLEALRLLVEKCNCFLGELDVLEKREWSHCTGFCWCQNWFMLCFYVILFVNHLALSKNSFHTWRFVFWSIGNTACVWKLFVAFFIQSLFLHYNIMKHNCYMRCYYDTNVCVIVCVCGNEMLHKILKEMIDKQKKITHVSHQG